MINTPEVQERIKREGAHPIGSTPEQFAARFRNEVAKWAKVAKDFRAGDPLRAGTAPKAPRSARH